MGYLCGVFSMHLCICIYVVYVCVSVYANSVSHIRYMVACFKRLAEAAKAEKMQAVLDSEVSDQLQKPAEYPKALAQVVG